MKRLTFVILLILLFVSGLNAQTITDKIILKTKTVDCNIDTVWWKWTTHEGLLTFFGADNSVELVPGGIYEIYFNLDSPEGQKGGEGNKVLSFLPLKMLSFTWNAPTRFPKIRNHEHRTWVVIEFNEISEKATEVNLSHLGWLEGEDWDAVYNYFDRAWEIVLDWLATSCEN